MLSKKWRIIQINPPVRETSTILSIKFMCVGFSSAPSENLGALVSFIIDEDEGLVDFHLSLELLDVDLTLFSINSVM